MCQFSHQWLEVVDRTQHHEDALKMLLAIRNCFRSICHCGSARVAIEPVHDDLENGETAPRGYPLERQESVVLGRESIALTGELADTAHLSILNFPAKAPGRITSVVVHLALEPPGGGRRWDVVVYKMIGGHRFRLESKRRIHLNSSSRSAQTIELDPPLPIAEGHFVGICNRDGKLRLTYTRGWEQEVATWDLWYQESQPPSRIGSTTPPLSMWNGSVGWYANMQPDEPEPEILIGDSMMCENLKVLVDDQATSDITFLVGPDQQPVYAHRCLLVSRSEYFHALLQGGFQETATRELSIPKMSKEVLLLLLEYIYTDELRKDELTRTYASLLEFAAQYCMARLVELCELELRDHVDQTTLLEIYLLSTASCADQLLEYCQYYGRKHKIHLPSSSPSLKTPTAASDNAVNGAAAITSGVASKRELN